jgi:hypothetical protein
MATTLLGSTGPSLPTEVVLLVLAHLADDNQALCTLARTCRGFQHLAEEQLYRTIELLSVKDLHAIINAFTYRHERARAVQTLKILYRYRPEDLKDSEDSRTTFNNYVAHMVNLREWHIESPYDNFNWADAGGHGWVERDMQCFREALAVACTEGPAEAERITAEQRLGKRMQRMTGLALLEKLTIHSHGAHADFWDLDGFHCLFRHPTLRYLHVSCVAFPPEEISELATHVKKSPLTTLVLDECELEPSSLLSILRTPANLKQLVLGENVFNVGHSRQVNPRLTKDAPQSLDALSAVAHSLESLTHLNPGWRSDFNPHIFQSMRPPGDGLRSFHRLKYLECDTTSFLHQAAIMNRNLAPPNLETLRIRRHWITSADFWDQPPTMDHYMALPSLATLELVQSSHKWSDLSHADYICDPDRVRNRHAKGYQLFKAGINLRVFIEMHRDPQLIPPYLHGELVPRSQCLYDANLVGFRRHIDNNTSSTDSDTELPSIRNKTPEGEPPETDQLGEADIARLLGETRRALSSLMRKFMRRRLPHGLESILDFYDEDDVDEEIDDLDEEEEMELDDLDEDEDMDLDDDDFEEFEDEDGVHIYEHNGEFYIEVYESETDEEEMGDALPSADGAIDDVD